MQRPTNLLIAHAEGARQIATGVNIPKERSKITTDCQQSDDAET
jgi:hypothetical protein